MDYLDNFKKWQAFEGLDKDLQKELDSLDDKGLQEAFDGELEFGTGGLRGIMGVGSNRLNIYTAKKIALGYANYLLKNEPKCKKEGIVICYDNRHNSKKFAEEIKNVITSLGIKTYLFKELRPTPYLSFAIRYLKTSGGLMITASHNPKEYNGIKAYNRQGGQLNLDESALAISEMKKITDPLSINVLGNDNLVIPILEKIDKAYFKELKKIKFLTTSKSAKILYSPLHATGYTVVPKFLKMLGYDIEVYKPHETLDPDFPNAIVTNPELPLAWKDIFEYALSKDVKPDLIAMTDPDCDRSGFAFLKDGKYHLINGNTQGVIALDYVLRSKKEQKTLKPQHNVFSTVVTTDLLRDISLSYNQDFYYTLTGFKFIGEKMDLVGGSKKFTFACEESIGAIIAPYVRDKDAIPLVYTFASFASYLKDNGIDFEKYLEENVYKKHGYYIEDTINVVREGKKGAALIKGAMDVIRQKGLVLKGYDLIQVCDFLTKEIKSKDNKVIDRLEFPSSNVVKFIYEWGWVVLRPSGTEPKLKVYFSVNTKEKQETIKLLEDIKGQVMSYINPLLEE